MAKDKKKHSKKDAVSDDLLDMAALSIKKFRKVTKQIGKLSTGQKIVGSLALAVAGLTYLAKQPATANGASPPTPPPAGGAAAEPAKLKASATRRKHTDDL